MNSHWHESLRQHLDRLAAQSLGRALTPLQQDGPWVVLPDGQRRVNLASNDYLGLANHPHLKAAAIQAIQNQGVGAGASRLVTGHGVEHDQLEKRFARFKHAQAALLLPTGYLANLAVLTTLAGPGDLICADKLCHASLIDAARASGATLRIFPHRNHDKLRRLLGRPGGDASEGENSRRNSGGNTVAPGESSNDPSRPARTFILTDSVFSMDGDAADLPALCDIAQTHRAILIVDEAHGTGVLGETGAGLCELAGVTDRVDIVISTASKALGSLGGIVTGAREVIDTLVNQARPFIYTTGTATMQPAVIGAAMDVLESEPWRRQRVQAMASRLRAALGLEAAIPTPIIPLVTGSAASALALSDRLGQAGFHAPAIRPPTVAPGAARVRLSLRADLEDEHVDRLIDLLLADPSRADG